MDKPMHIESPNSQPLPGYTGDPPAEQETVTVPNSLLEKLVHFRSEIRRLGFQEVLGMANISRTTHEIDTFLTQDFLTLIKDTDPENQQLIIQIYTNVFISTGNVGSLEFNKKQFWHTIFNQYLSSANRQVLQLAIPFFDSFFKACDQKVFLETCLELLSKNLLKTSKVIYGIFTQRFHEIDVWETFLKQALEVLEKHIVNPNKDIKSGAMQLLKNLSLVDGVEITQKLKGAKPELVAEVTEFFNAQKNNPELKNRYPKLQLKLVKKTTSRRTISNLSEEAFKQAPPMNIVTKYNADWVERTMEIKKWNERKDEIDKLLAQPVTRLSTQDSYYNLAEMAKRLVNESNVQLQICGLKIYSLLARGLRTAAKGLLKSIFPELINRLKVLNSAFTKCLQDLLEMLFLVFSVEELMTEFKVYNANRNKDIRMELLVTIGRLFRFLKDQPEKKSNLLVFLKLCPEVLNVYFEDPDSKIRGNTKELTKTILEGMADDLPSSMIFQNNLDKSKVKDVIDAVNAANLKKEGESRRTVLSGDKRPQKIDPQQSVLKKKQEMSVSMPEIPGSNSKQRDSHRKAQKRLSKEEINAQIISTVGEHIVGFISDKDFQFKESGLTQLCKHIQSTHQEFFDRNFVQTVLGFLRLEFKDFSESNLKIMKAIVKVFETFISKNRYFDSILSEFSLLFVKKVSDAKFKAQVTAILKQLCEHLGRGKVLAAILEHEDIFRDQFKTVADICDALTQMQGKPGERVTGEALSKLLLMGLNSVNQQTRTSAFELFKQVAPGLTSAAVNAILEKVENSVFQNSIKDDFSKLAKAQLLTSSMPTPKAPYQGEPKPSIAPASIKSAHSSKEPSKRQDRGTSRQQNSHRSNVSSSYDNRKTNRDKSAHKQENQTAIWNEIQRNLIKHDQSVRLASVSKIFDFLHEHPSFLTGATFEQVYQAIRARLNDTHKAVSLRTLELIRQTLNENFKLLKLMHKRILFDMIQKSIEKSVKLSAPGHSLRDRDSQTVCHIRQGD